MINYTIAPLLGNSYSSGIRERPNNCSLHLSGRMAAAEDMELAIAFLPFLASGFQE